MKTIALSALVLTGLFVSNLAQAALVTNPNDARNWQGATVGTFAALYYGSNTLANRTSVVTSNLLDDGIFNPTGYSAASLVPTPWATGGGGGCLCTSLDNTGTGSYAYTSGGSLVANANAIDDFWFQSAGVPGQTVFDLHGNASKAVVFAVIDHGPLPDESIESTVYLSNDMVTWTQAVVERIWLEGYKSNLGIQWDGFAYAVGTGTSATFKYASIIHGGPAALEDDGDDEINGMMGLLDNFTPIHVPEPATWAIFSIALGLLGFNRKRA